MDPNGGLQETPLPQFRSFTRTVEIGDGFAARDVKVFGRSLTLGPAVFFFLEGETSTSKQASDEPLKGLRLFFSISFPEVQAVVQ